MISHAEQIRHRTWRLVTSVVPAVATAAAVLAVPAAASAADTTPTVQLDVSRVRFVSVVATPEVGVVSDVAFDTAVAAQQPYANVRDEGEEGDGRVPLTRSNPRLDYSDANFVHSAQFSYSSNSFQWSTRLSDAWRTSATSPVAESTFWYVNGGKAYGSGHVQAPSYTFHGSFSVRPGDTVDMANEFTFECGPDTTCSGTLYSSYYIAT